MRKHNLLRVGAREVSHTRRQVWEIAGDGGCARHAILHPRAIQMQYHGRGRIGIPYLVTAGRWCEAMAGRCGRQMTGGPWSIGVIEGRVGCAPHVSLHPPGCQACCDDSNCRTVPCWAMLVRPVLRCVTVASSHLPWRQPGPRQRRRLDRPRRPGKWSSEQVEMTSGDESREHAVLVCKLSVGHQ